MAEETKQPEAERGTPESQKQRWIKYGSNVVLTVIVVILLAAAVTYLAQLYNRRVDTTAQRVYSLKPQTLAIIRDLDQPVRIVGLYHRPDQPREGEADYAQVVSDLLKEYQQKGRNITVEMIDPVKDVAKKEELINYVTQHYGGEVQRYREFVENFPKAVQPIRDFANAELPLVQALPFDAIPSRPLRDDVEPTVKSVEVFTRVLDNAQEEVEQRLRLKPPDYRGAVDAIDMRLEPISQAIDEILRRFEGYQNSQNLAEPIRAYVAQATPRYQQVKQVIDDILQRGQDLGELKLDEVRQKLNERNPILVLGRDEMRSLSFQQIWQEDRTARELVPDAQPQPRFAGEQQITTAIFSLTQPARQKIAFVRTGGPPLTTPGFPLFQRGGPFSEVAQRLRDYNFEVLEKDLSGMWAMQAQMQQMMPPPPEPSDEELRNAIWIVVNMPMDRRMGMPPASPAASLHEHLSNGGGAMVLMMPQADDLAVALKEWGVEALTDAILVHEVPRIEGDGPQDIAERAQREPYIFVINDFGDHPLARPLRTLDGLLIGMTPIRSTEAPGLSSSPLLPIPTQPRSWGERDLTSIEERQLAFDPERDVAPPLYGGAAVDKEGAGRLVVFGGFSLFTDGIVSFPDLEMLRTQRRLVTRFPGNGELFANAVFWLANMETMMAISPAAMEISRIAPMSDTVATTWRTGVLMIGLPLLVVLAGIGVYFMRRD